MPLELAIRNRLAVCALMLMLAPYGISLPAFAKAAQAKPDDGVVKLADLYTDGYMPSLHTGGTIALPHLFTIIDPSRKIR